MLAGNLAVDKSRSLDDCKMMGRGSDTPNATAAYPATAPIHPAISLPPTSCHSSCPLGEVAMHRFFAYKRTLFGVKALLFPATPIK